MRAQASIEFLAVFSILMVLFLFLFSFAGDVSRDMHFKRERLSAISVTDALALYINLAYQGGDGAAFNVSLRPSVLGSPYNFSVYGNNLVVFWDGSHYSSPLVTGSVNLTVSNSTDVFIHNVNGVVIVE